MNGIEKEDYCFLMPRLWVAITRFSESEFMATQMNDRKVEELVDLVRTLLTWLGEAEIPFANRPLVAATLNVLRRHGRLPPALIEDLDDAIKSIALEPVCDE
jgi:hypothetical protein